MKVVSTTLDVDTNTDHEYIDITDAVQGFVKKSGVKKGIANLFGQHTTAALVVQEADNDMHEDTAEALLRLLPLDKSYRHSDEGNLNATAHIKNQMIGGNLTLPIENGKIALGTWQRILFLELYQARKRKVHITVMGE